MVTLDGHCYIALSIPADRFTSLAGAKNIIGQVTGDNQQQGEGKAQQKSGDTQRGINQ